MPRTLDITTHSRKRRSLDNDTFAPMSNDTQPVSTVNYSMETAAMLCKSWDDIKGEWLYDSCEVCTI